LAERQVPLFQEQLKNRIIGELIGTIILEICCDGLVYALHQNVRIGMSEVGSFVSGFEQIVDQAVESDF
jgi:hypothetical protein